MADIIKYRVKIIGGNDKIVPATMVQVDPHHYKFYIFIENKTGGGKAGYMELQAAFPYEHIESVTKVGM